MRVDVLIDMHLSPAWGPVLRRHGWPAAHGATGGDPRATGRTLMGWVVANGVIVLTHDLAVGTMLALTHATGPSVLQVRAEDVLPDQLEGVVIAALKQHAAELASGALVVVDESRARVRGLPICGVAPLPPNQALQRTGGQRCGTVWWGSRRLVVMLPRR